MLPEIHALELAIAHGDTSEVQKAVESNPGIVKCHFSDNIGLSPLMWACRNRHTAIVECLLINGANPNERNQAEENGDGGNTALWFTAQGPFPGTVPVARLLLARGVDVNARCEHGTTPLYMAVAWVHMELVQLLLSHGADSSIPNLGGMLPLESIRKDYEWSKTQDAKTENMKRLENRAPRMIAFLEKIKNG